MVKIAQRGQNAGEEPSERKGFEIPRTPTSSKESASEISRALRINGLSDFSVARCADARTAVCGIEAALVVGIS